MTLSLIFLPTLFNLFELLRFRLVSHWIEDNVLTTTTEQTKNVTEQLNSSTAEQQQLNLNPNNNAKEQQSAALTVERSGTLKLVAVFVAKSISNFFLLLSWLSVALLRYSIYL